jgi:O-antigen/teichoic acid export membrane protein
VVRALARARRDHEGTILYTASSVAQAGAGLVATFITMRVVAPADLGLWTTVTLATTYSAFLQAGINNGLNRELPYSLGAGDDARARKLAGTAQAFTFASCLLALAGGLALMLFFRARDTTFLTVIAVETIAILCFFYQSYLVVTFRSTTSFKLLGTVQFLGVLAGLAALPLVYYWNFHGMLWRIAGTSLLGVALLHVVRPIRVGLEWDRESLARLLKTGLPIFLMFYVESSFSTFDRVFLVTTGGVEQVGYYSLALMAQQAMLVVPTSLAVIMYSRMTYHWGKEQDRRALWNRAWKSTLAASAVMVPLVVAAYVVLPLLVGSFFPRYLAGIPAARILLIGSLFNGTAVGVNALWSMKAWKYMATYQLGGACLRALGPYVALLLYRDPLTAVALGTACACFLQFALGMILTFHATAGGAHPSGDPIAL